MRKIKKQRRSNRWKDMWWLIFAGAVLLALLCVVFVFECIIWKDVSLQNDPAAEIRIPQADNVPEFEEEIILPDTGADWFTAENMPLAMDVRRPVDEQDGEYNEASLTLTDAAIAELSAAETAEPTATPMVEPTGTPEAVSLPVLEITTEAEPAETPVFVNEIEITPAEESSSESVDAEEDLPRAEIIQIATANRALAASACNTAWIEDGKAHIIGDNQHDQCNVDAWPRVQKVCLGNAHAIGLTEDGRIVYSGSNSFRQQDLNIDNQKVIDIEASAYASYVVLEDGTVRMSGSACASAADLQDINDAVAIAAEDTHLVVLRADGTLAAFGDDDTGACDVRKWKDIIMVDCGYGFTIALDKNGRVYITGNDNYGQSKLDGAENMVAVAAGSNTCFAVDAQGNVHAAGSNSKGQTDTREWENIAFIAAGYRHTVAMNDSGERMAIGDDSYGQIGGLK